MLLKRVGYRNFRNIETALICPGPDVTVLNGKNGQGKTNMLEGIYIFARGKSFRTTHEEELIMFGKNLAEIRLTYENAGVTNELSITLNRQTKKKIFKKNGVPISKSSEIIGLFNAVLFCPQQMAIINGGPGERRQFLNIVLSMIDPVYLASLQRYGKLLEQKNALIKSFIFGYSQNREQFDLTNGILISQLAREWKLISEKRYDYTLKLNEIAGNIITDLAFGKEKLEISYPVPKTVEDYEKELFEAADREIKYGTTLCGAHREDMTVLLNGKNSRDYASQGQQRSLLLAMKLAEGEILKLSTGHYPVFLLDDILSELDTDRRKYLLSELKERQVIITSCDSIETSGKLYKVEAGATYELS